MEARPRLVLGVDFSPASERARDAAIRLAKEWGAHVVLVHALRPLGSPGLDLGHPQYDPERNESADVTAAQDVAREWLHIVRQQVPGDLVSRPGRPAEVLLEEAKRVHARAIVVGSHGATGIERAVLGSVAEAVLAGSLVPVIVVPGRTAAEGAEGEAAPATKERPAWLQ
jgi:nucleotide-binding universal stress UspA family protein